jgi:hypothetical protein
MNSNLSKYILLFGLNYLEDMNNSLDKKKYLRFNNLL